MKENYFDEQGNYINVENLSLADIYHRAFALGVESTSIGKTGKWKPKLRGYHGKEIDTMSFICSECGREIYFVQNHFSQRPFTEELDEFLKKYHYCHCGAKMEVEDYDIR